MSLMERVRYAGNDAACTTLSSRPCLLDQLKLAVYEHLPADDIASMVESNPHRAKNEIRSACNRIFEEGVWLMRDAEGRMALVDDLLDEIFGFGPLERMLDDEEITEIMVNGIDSIYFEREGKLYRGAHAFSSDGQVRALIDRIIGPLGRRIDESSPMVNARLPKGHRVNAIIPPIALDGPVMTIRKFTARVMTLDEMVAGNTMDAVLQRFLIWAVKAKKNIAVSGGTGSGKTTLLNALSCEIPFDERIVTIEDSAELRFLEHPHVVRLEARPLNAEGQGEITIRELVINALRMRPDRIVVGECRSGETIEMLQAMNTGHDGSLTTLHANAPEEAILRLTTMVRYAVDLPVDVIEAQIASAIDIIVQIARGHDGCRYVTQVVELTFSRKESLCGVHPVFRRLLSDEAGEWEACPSWIDDLPRREYATSEEVQAWKQSASLSL